MTANSKVRRCRGLVVVLVAGGLVAGACGGDDDSGASAATTGTEATTAATAGGDTTVAADTTMAAAPMGAPIKVMTETAIDTNLTAFPSIRDTSKYFAQWVNDQGGLVDGNGTYHLLEVTFCDDKQDPSEAANCARKAVDEQLVANIGSSTLDASRAIPIYEENQVAWFGLCCPLADQESKSEISFPLGFTAGFATAAAIKMHEDGCTKVVDSYGDFPFADLFHSQFLNGWKSVGRTDEVKTIIQPVGPGDYTSQIAQVPDDADCLFALIGEINYPSVLTAAKQLGKELRFYGAQGSLTAIVANDYPAETEGAVVMGTYPDIASPVFDDFRAALDKYGASDEIDWNTHGGLGTWTAYVAFADIVSHMTGEITSETFLEAAQNTTALETAGILPTIDLTTEWTGGGGQFPRIFNRVFYASVIHDGKLAPLEGTYDVTTAVDGKPS